MDLSEQFEEFHRKQWFPEKYPDPFGEFIDAINDETLALLSAHWEKSPDRRHIYLAQTILNLLPRILHQEVAKDLEAAYNQRLSLGIQPRFFYYYLRALQNEERDNAWTGMRQWTERWRGVLTEWYKRVLSIESQHHKILNGFHTAIGLDLESAIARIERWLTGTRELFQWEIERFAGADLNLPRILSAFRLHEWDHLFDWNDFKSIAKHFAETVHVKKVPELQESIHDPVQFGFPIHPPSRVTVEHGRAAGPVDAMRFITEYAKSCYYSGINMELSPEFRVAGDPSVPQFWGYLFAIQMARNAGIKRFIGITAEDLAPAMRLYFEFWIRLDAALSIYRHRIDRELKDSQDLYVACRELVLPDKSAYFLNLFDLEQSAGAIYRVHAAEAAIAVNNQFQLLFGNDWFSSEKCVSRIRDYWREGTSMSLREIIQDLGITQEESFNLNWSER